MVDKEARINKLYQAIGLISLKKAAIGYEELAKKAEHEKNQKIAALNYEEAAEGYNYILNFDRAKKCYTISISYLTELCNDTLKNKDYEISIHLFDKLSNLHGKLSLLIDRILLQVKDLDKNTRQSLLEEKSNALNLVKNAKMNIAMAHEYLALNYIKNKDLDYRQIAEKEYQNAIKILESIGEIQEAKKIELRKSKVLK